MDTLIKWVGGKRRFLKYIKPILPKEFNNYFEPFFGSGALFFSIESPNDTYVSDWNKSLINFYHHVSTNGESLHKNIKKFLKSVEENTSKYYEVRELFNIQITNNRINSMTHAVYFFFLNKVGFNGMYRVNMEGTFNIPVGRHSSHALPELNEFLKAAELFKKSRIQAMGWVESVQRAQRGDLVYLDPPYYPSDSSKFTGYTDPAFGVANHEELVRICDELVNRGVYVVVSNSDSSEFSELMGVNDNFDSQIINTKRSINPKAVNKERFKEALFFSKNIQRGING